MLIPRRQLFVLWRPTSTGKTLQQGKEFLSQYETLPFWVIKLMVLQAKGYPDIQTRQFLRRLSTKHPSTPILALVDFDPDGIGIMSTYKHGSMNLAHESHLAVPSLQWLGVRSCDFLQNENDIQGLLNLSARDRRIAVKMLEKGACETNYKDEDWRKELQVMLVLNVKAEIQILGNGNELGAWLDGKMADKI